MNCETGELRNISQMDESQVEELRTAGFVQVPKELQEEATEQLAGQDSVFVDYSVQTPLVKWATQRKIGRNEKCPCGSGLKYKRCCLGKDPIVGIDLSPQTMEDF